MIVHKGNVSTSLNAQMEFVLFVPLVIYWKEEHALNVLARTVLDAQIHHQHLALVVFPDTILIVIVNVSLARMDVLLVLRATSANLAHKHSLCQFPQSKILRYVLLVNLLA